MKLLTCKNQHLEDSSHSQLLAQLHLSLSFFPIKEKAERCEVEEKCFSLDVVSWKAWLTLLEMSVSLSGSRRETDCSHRSVDGCLEYPSSRRALQCCHKYSSLRWAPMQWRHQAESIKSIGCYLIIQEYLKIQSQKSKSWNNIRGRPASHTQSAGWSEHCRAENRARHIMCSS